MSLADRIRRASGGQRLALSESTELRTQLLAVVRFVKGIAVNDALSRRTFADCVDAAIEAGEQRLSHVRALQATVPSLCRQIDEMSVTGEEGDERSGLLDIAVHAEPIGELSEALATVTSWLDASPSLDEVADYIPVDLDLVTMPAAELAGWWSSGTTLASEASSFLGADPTAAATTAAEEAVGRSGLLEDA